MRTRITAAAVAVAAAVALSALTVPSLAADNKGSLKRQQGSVQKKLDAAQSDADESNAKLLAASRALDRASAKLAAAKGELSATRGRLAVAKAVDARLRIQLASAQAELAKAESKLTRANADLADSRARVQEFAVQSVVSGNRGLETLSKLVGGSTPAELTETESVNDSVGDAQLATMAELDAATVMLRVQERSAQRLRDRVAANKAEAARNVAAMAALTQKAQAQTASVATLVSARAKARAAAEKIADEDLAKVAQYEAERKRIQRKLAAIVAAELAKARRKSASSGGGSGSGDSGGALSHPVSGPITSPYGMRYHPIKHVWKLHDGTDFGVACGTPVKAAAGGTIISQYYNSAYGNRLLLNNGVKRGVSVITIYNHLSSFKYAAGRKVSRGQVIAYSGTTGLSTGCHLHFMVLVNGHTVNPMGWL